LAICLVIGLLAAHAACHGGQIVSLALAQPVTSPGNAAAGAAVDRSHWADQEERIEAGPEADLVVRLGAINNLGFGWPEGFDPFTGQSTPVHGWPWTPPADAPPGLKRITTGSGVTEHDVATRNGDGYSNSTQRRNTQPTPITVVVGRLPDKIDSVLFQFFLDDFQAPVFGSHFQVSLNGTRIPAFEQAVNSLDQTGPIGKLVSLRLLPEYYDLLRSGTVKILFDDPLTHMPDGYAIDFVRVLINVHRLDYQVTLKGRVLDAATHRPISGASVTAGLSSTQCGRDGTFVLSGIPAGLVIATASHAGYSDAVRPVDLVAGQIGQVEFLLAVPKEDAAILREDIQRTGVAAVYGIHFDFDKAKLRPDSLPALRAVVSVMQQDPQAHWTIAGHTDNKGTREHNLGLSQARAAAVVDWLARNGISQDRLHAAGLGSDHPVADNVQESGRALNRRVELQKDM
jgi:outer membrane protein OmpA-like peptidoglycan-associated protein